MKIKIISLRKTTDKAVETLEAHYLKRFARYASVERVDIKRAKISAAGASSSRSDLDKILTRLSPHDHIVLLSEHGRLYNTTGFTDFVCSIINEGKNSLVFIIGGPNGYPRELEERAHARIALSSMTFPHQLIRLLLIEALYRSFDIMKGGSYNK
jgi:23S rRNA (pseudouridine1915-N3)-methyltransferase